MIIRETEHDFVMIAQHDHARLSGDIAANFIRSVFGETTIHSRVEDVLYAIYEHDRGWIRLDDRPIWNDADEVPFSFMDYPELPKLVLYRWGVDEVERNNEYAALLCSLHYASFYAQTAGLSQAYSDFVHYERERQARLRKKLDIEDDAVVHRHFQLLKLCDRISLYVCLNEPGVTKEAEHPWYREGFKQSERLFDAADDRTMIAHWSDGTTVRLTPFPFESSFTATLVCKQVSKQSIRQSGIDRAYKAAERQERLVTFTGD